DPESRTFGWTDEARFAAIIVAGYFLRNYPEVAMLFALFVIWLPKRRIYRTLPRKQLVFHWLIIIFFNFSSARCLTQLSGMLRDPAIFQEAYGQKVLGLSKGFTLCISELSIFFSLVMCFTTFMLARLNYSAAITFRIVAVPFALSHCGCGLQSSSSANAPTQGPFRPGCILEHRYPAYRVWYLRSVRGILL
ncbi:MAG TPA: hypothetical protein VGE41_10970, partial [Verrucomicrobiae bacterium]